MAPILSMAVNPGANLEKKFADINECVDSIAVNEFLAALQCYKIENPLSPGTNGMNFDLINCVPYYGIYNIFNIY